MSFSAFRDILLTGFSVCFIIIPHSMIVAIVLLLVLYVGGRLNAYASSLSGGSWVVLLGRVLFKLQEYKQVTKVLLPYIPKSSGNALIRFQVGFSFYIQI